MSDVRIVEDSLGGSALSLAVQRGDAAPGWTAPVPASSKAWRERMLARASAAPWAERMAELAPAFAATGAAAARLERVIHGGGVAVTTGQQPGLFGGPVYTWSKAASAIALADALERETGVPVVPIFWAATDDADFAEAASTMLAGDGGVIELRLPNAPAAGTPMSLTPLGDISPLLARLRDVCGSVPDARALAAVERGYTAPDATVAGAYLDLLRTLLEPLGMPVLDASHPVVTGASRALLEHALSCGNSLALALDARTRELEVQGFAPQVDLVRNLSLVFGRTGALKERLPIVTSPEASTVLTPNVLLRPVVEHEMLPTVAYVAGPGELAYFAQVSAVADALGLDAPVAVPRWSCTLIEPSVGQTLAMLGATPADLETPDALETRLAHDALGEPELTALADFRVATDRLETAVRERAAGLGLTAAVEGARQGLHHRADRLERRLVAGVKRHEARRMHEVRVLRAALRPGGHRQERTLNLIPMLSRHGLVLLSEMVDAASAHAARLVDGGPSESVRT